MSFFGRLSSAVTTLPTASHWRRAILEMLWLAPVLALLAWAGGLIAVGRTPDLLALAGVAAGAFIVPALLEELMFRVTLMPAPQSGASLARCALAIGAFVAWRPLQLLWFGPEWGAVVLNPLFLLAVAVLGVGLTRLYLATGSVWPPVVVHWLIVVAWKAAGGASPWS